MKISKLHVVINGWLFLISLSSFYFYGLNISLPPLIAAVFSLAAMPILLKRQIAKELVSLGFLFAFIVYLTVFGVILILVGEDLLINRFFAMPLFVGVVISSVFFLVHDRKVFASSIKFVICAHLFAFYIQAISYYAGFGFIDYLQAVTGEEQRAFGGGYGIDFLGGLFLRPTGLYNEPGTYSTAMMLMFLLYERIKKSVVDEKSNKELLLTIFVIFSVLISFSVFGLVFVFIYVANLIRDSEKSFLIFFLIVLVIAPIVYEVYLFPRFFSGQYSDDGIGFRSQILYDYLDLISKNPMNLLFGFGFFSDITIWFGDSVTNDVGLFFSVLLQTGVVGFGLFLICIFGKRGLSRKNISLVLIFGLCKISMTTMLFWLVFTAIAMFNYSKIYNPRNKLR